MDRKMPERDRKTLKAVLLLDRLFGGDNPKGHLKRKKSSMRNAELLTDSELDEWLLDLEWQWTLGGISLEERLSGDSGQEEAPDGDGGPGSWQDEDDWCYTPSVTGGDYGPGNPWDAPGMSIHDFI